MSAGVAAVPARRREFQNRDLWMIRQGWKEAVEWWGFAVGSAAVFLRIGLVKGVVFVVATFNRAGVQFDYPENWSIIDDQFTDAARVVSLESPGGAMWTLQVTAEWTSPWKLAQQVVETLRGEYENVESESVEETIDNVEVVGYDMHFYCLDFVVAAKARSFYSGGKTFVVWYQAEDRDFDGLEPVFFAMMTSLIRKSSAL